MLSFCSQVGRTKVFFRPGVLGYVEDMWARMQRCAGGWDLSAGGLCCMFQLFRNSYRLQGCICAGQMQLVVSGLFYVEQW